MVFAHVLSAKATIAQTILTNLAHMNNSINIYIYICEGICNA